MRLPPVVLVLATVLAGCEREHLIPFVPCGESCYPSGYGKVAGVGACRMGTLVCRGDEEPVCEGYVLPEVVDDCDGIDNDCNGVTDPVLRTCANNCGEGFQKCLDGAWTECSAPSPQPEVCNAKDDDCDGLVDEEDELPIEFCYDGPPRTVGKGICRPGVKACLNGRLECAGWLGPTMEQCDGLDNDCNGLIDDGLAGNVPYDFVFMIDESGSMQPTIASVQSAIAAHTKTALATSRYALILVPPSDPSMDGQIRMVTNLTDAQSFAGEVSKLASGYTGVERTYDALYMAAKDEYFQTIADTWEPIAWRKGSAQVVILFTDEEGQSARMFAEADVAAAFSSTTKIVYVFGLPEYSSSFDDIAKLPHGQWFSLKSDIQKALNGVVLQTCEP